MVAYGDPEGAEAARQAFAVCVRQYHRRFKLGGYKMFLDGSPQGRTAWLRRPYQGEQDYRGYGTLTDAEVLDMVRRAGTDGMQLLAHCNGMPPAPSIWRRWMRRRGKAWIWRHCGR